jgi:hypothetical protein
MDMAKLLGTFHDYVNGPSNQNNSVISQEDVLY